MYMPPKFEEKDLPTLHRAIADRPFGALIAATPDGLEANHLPFLLLPDQGRFGTLRCHVARANALWQIASGAALEGLAIFQGPAAYISPSLYQTKQETHKVVPTYNYVAIHAHGRIVVHDDARWLRALLAELTRRHESGRAQPWKMGDAPADFLDERLQEIVGIEIEITRLEGKWKMSQNRTPADQASVAAGLRDSADPAERAVAALVEQCAQQQQ
jgi:transcriptional regulator